MNRREFLKNIGVGAAALAAGGQTASARLFSNKAVDVKMTTEYHFQLPKNPNIVLMISDDMTYHDIGCFGAVNNFTPNIDKLATEGMKFPNGFTATAMCAPMRSMTYTGLYPVRNGCYPNHYDVKAGTKSLGHYFKDIGYRVGLSGKTHIGPIGATKPFPFEILGTSGGEPSFPAMESFITRSSTQPFFLILTSHYPHGPATVWSDIYVNNEANFQLRPYMVDTPELRHNLAGYYSEIAEFDKEVKRALDLLDKYNIKNNTIFVFLSEQGSALPHAKWTCYDMGLHTACIVRWPAVIKPNTVNNAMIETVDIVPTLLEAASAAPIAGLDGKSFFQALLGKTEHHKDYVYGIHTNRNIIDSKNAGYPIRSIRSERYKYIRNLIMDFPDSVYSPYDKIYQNVITTGGPTGVWGTWKTKAGYPSVPPKDTMDYKIVDMYLNRPAEEFYDIVADPYELNNLASDPANRPIMDAMRVKLQAWMTQQGDQGMATEQAASN